MISLVEPSDICAMEEKLHRTDVAPLNELATFNDALDLFSKLVANSDCDSVQLHCTVPTWSSSDTCLDLHDLNDLQTRALLFIHSLTESLRTSGIPASYRLAPSNSSLCLVCPLSPRQDVNKVKAAAFMALKGAKLVEREKLLLVDSEYGPALIIT